MITRVVYNNKSFKILNNYGFKFSNSEVTFNDIKIDFSECSIADIPFKFQEIKIMQADTEENIFDGKILFTGYLEDIKLSDMKMQKEFREITLTLLSPLKMATKRCVSLIGTYSVSEAITRVLQPLIDDGFMIKEFNISEGQITTNFVLETVENCMNNIGFKRNIFWFINENKEIFVNSIDYMFGRKVASTINQSEQNKGLLKIQPTIQNVGYANIINFKNVRLIYASNNDNFSTVGTEYPIIEINKNIKKGDIITFDNPIIIDAEMLKSFGKENKTDIDTFFYSLYLDIELTDTTYKTYSIQMNLNEEAENYGQLIIDGNISFSNSGGDEGEIVLQRDGFFSNLITGFKWNYDSNGRIVKIRSDNTLRYTSMRFMYSAEIERLKGIISESGQIENTIDYNSKWTTLPQLIEYARSLMSQNSNEVNQIELKYDVNPNLKIGDIVSINAPDFYIQGNFAVKDIAYNYETDIKQTWTITLKSTDLISTYIDMFRPQETESSQDTINTVLLSEFIEEKIKETHSIDIVEGG